MQLIEESETNNKSYCQSLISDTRPSYFNISAQKPSYCDLSGKTSNKGFCQ